MPYIVHSPATATTFPDIEQAAAGLITALTEFDPTGNKVLFDNISLLDTPTSAAIAAIGTRLYDFDPQQFEYEVEDGAFWVEAAA